MEKQLKKWLKKVKLSEPTISTLLGAFVIIIVGLLIFNYFKSDEPQEDIQLSGGGELAFTVPEKEESQENIPDNLPETYVVQDTDSLWKISEKFYGSGYNWTDIAAENSLVNPDLVTSGTELKLPKVAAKTLEQEEDVAGATVIKDVEAIKENSYTVQKGDYLWMIAIKAYGDGYKWPEIAEANNLVNPDYLEEGQVLNLPR